MSTNGKIYTHLFIYIFKVANREVSLVIFCNCKQTQPDLRTVGSVTLLPFT